MRKIKSEQIRFDVIINGNKAQKELYDLEKANRNLTSETKALRLEKLKLERAGKKESKEYKQTTALLREKNATLKANKARMSELQKEIGLTGLTMHQLNQRARQLRLQLNHMIPGSKERIQMENDLKKINARLNELRLKGRQAESSISKLSQTFNKYAVLGTTVIASISGVIFSMQRFIDFNNKISDAQSDVMKTTSMTRKEVDELTNSFGELNTRTSRMDLLVIAKEGGRLGLPKEEIADFVKYVNIATVALADGFSGGVEEVAPMLGKLKFLFDETKDAGVAEAYSEIGSALNELAKNGISTEKNIAEFATRVGSLPPALKPSIADALALGAAFEESGIKAEVGSRAWGIILRQATTNTDKFAKVMGWTQEQVEELINLNPTEFMLQFGAALEGASATDIGEVFHYLGVNADGANKAIGALTGNTDRFRKMMEISAVGMEEATSMLDEYEIKNNNLAATWEKLQKRFRGIFLSETLVSGLESWVNWFAKLIGATEDADGKITVLRDTLVFLFKILVVGIATTLSYNAGVRLTALLTNNAYRSTKLYLAVKRSLVVTQRLATAALLLGRAAFYALTGQVTKASWAMLNFNRIVSASPLGLLLVAVTSLYTAYRLFGQEAEKAMDKQMAFNKASAVADKNIVSQTSRLKTLQRVAEDESASQNARIAAIKEINKIVPGYNENIELTTEALKDGKKAIDQYIDSLHEKMKVQALENLIREQEEKMAKLSTKGVQEEVKWYDYIFAALKTGGNSVAMTNKLLEKAIDKRNEKLQEGNKTIDTYRDALSELLKDNPSLIEEDNSTFTNLLDEDADANLKSLNDKLYKTLQEELRARNSLLLDSLDRELDMLDIHYQDKIKRLKDNLETGSDLTAEQLAINESINKQLLLQEETYERDRGAILQRAIEKEMQEASEQFKREELLRKTAQNKELAALGDNEEAKKKLRKHHQDMNAKFEEEHLREILELYNDILADSEFRGMSLDILSDEQRDAIIKNLEEVGFKISELREKATGESEGEADIESFAERQDILGFTATQWLETFENLETTEDKIEAVAMAVQGLNNAWAMFNQFASNNDRKRLQDYEAHNDTMRRKLDRRLELGMINERQYNQAVEQLDEDLAKHKAEFEYKEAKRKKEMTIAQIAQNTALGITSALTSVPPNLVLAGIIGGIGAAQMAVAVSTPLPAKGFEEGFYPVRREQDGKEFQARFGGTSGSGEVDFPTVFLAGEQGKDSPEMIISGGHYKRFDPQVKALLHSEINRVRGYEDGFYRESESNQDLSFLRGLLEANIITLSELNSILEKGIEAKLVRSMENADKIDRDIKRLKRIKESSRV